MTGLANLLFRGFQAVLDFFAGIVGSLWSAFLLVLDAVVSVVVAFTGVLLTFLVQLVKC